MEHRCCMCGKLLTDENSSLEHIIHNAIGGTLTDKNIYCKKCNNEYGSKEDKAFTDIFATLMDRLDIRRARKSKGSPYTGIMFDSQGNAYEVTCKDKKIIQIFDKDKHFIHAKDIEGKKKPDIYNFTLDNTAFKKGMAKIAFNYAMHCGLAPEKMDLLFDRNEHKISDRIGMIPFVPMTMFDAFMEGLDDDKLYHALRIFNIQNFLCVYIELFSTFQYYIILSESYEGKDIDKSYCLLIEKRKFYDEDIASFTPSNYKEAILLLQEYDIDYENDVKKLMKEKYGGDSYADCDVYKEIANLILKKKQNESYEVDYGDIVSSKFRSLSSQVFYDMIQGLEKRDARAFREFVMEASRIYTISQNDEIDMYTYKKFLPVYGNKNGAFQYSSYPHECAKLCHDFWKQAQFYGHSKFHKLEQRLWETV